MKVTLYTNSVSAHQLPLAREIVARVGAENFRYLYTGENLQKCGQEVAVSDPWIVQESKHKDEVEQWLENSEVLLSGIRANDLFERRAAKGLKTFYQSERWFKPIPLHLNRILSIVRLRIPTSTIQLPGYIRMLVPSYRRMAKRFAALVNADPNFKVLAIGPWAKKDFLRIGVRPDKLIDWAYYVEPGKVVEVEGVGELKCGVEVEGERGRELKGGVEGEGREGKLKCGVEVEGERGRELKGGVEVGSPSRTKEVNLHSSTSTQDFDSSSTSTNTFNSSSTSTTNFNSSSTSTQDFDSKPTSPQDFNSHQTLRVLWVGRMLDWKRVDTIIRAVAYANSTRSQCSTRPISLTLVGTGPEEPALRRLAEKLSPRSTTTTSTYNFLPPVPISEVRSLMRSHDIYVLASNAQEGWGAALSEAILEGMTCFGTREAGASAALLAPDKLFHCGDYKALSRLLLRFCAAQIQAHHSTTTTNNYNYPQGLLSPSLAAANLLTF